jgi:hypothetical protein
VRSITSSRQHHEALRRVGAFDDLKRPSAKIGQRIAKLSIGTEKGGFLINDPDRIRSIGAREWACVNP